MNWNPNLYENQHSFVWQFGTDLIELLSPKPGERILDLGCGTGQLTAKIAERGAEVIGMDNSPNMIAQAHKNYPHLSFILADGTNFSIEPPVHAIFSNAALHWMKPPIAVVQGIWQALKPQGRFVAEFGGQGNVHSIISAILTTLDENGYPESEDLHPWYFPSIGDYTTLLEQQGFSVTYATLFDRPTPLESEEKGIQNWLAMFASNFLIPVPVHQQPKILSEIEEKLRPKLYSPNNNSWFADYRRIRVIAYKLS